TPARTSRPPPSSRFRCCHPRALPRRDRPSFPTRRSSDLLSVQRALPGNWDLTLGYAGSHGLHLIRVADANLAPSIIVNGVKTYRSEEHTSELQSLRHLVCRLLIEKKNETVLSTHGKPIPE